MNARPPPALLIAALALNLVLACGRAVAAVEDEEPKDSSYGVTGDWNGLRDRLKDEGWTFQAREKFEAADLLSGGRRLAVGAGETRLGATADLGKLFGLKGGKVQLTVTDRYGSSLGPSSGLDPLMLFIEVHGRGDIWRLTQLSYAQDLPGGFNLKLGRVNPGTDFDAFSCKFENLTFCGAPPGNLVGDYWYNWPVSSWGARLKWTRGDLYAEGGVYQVNQSNLRHGFTLDAGGRGSLWPVEIGWTPKLGASGLPGTWLIGGWYGDLSAPELGAAPNAPRSRHGRYGGYLSITQQVTGTAGGKGLSVLLNAARADRFTSRLESQVALGLSYTGLLPGRPSDETALAFGVTHVNGRIPGASAVAGAPTLGSEKVVELDYRIKAFNGLTLTPNLQYVNDPGGRPGRHGAVLGLKTSLKF